MRRITVVSLLAFLVQAHAKEPAANTVGDAQNFMDKLTDKLMTKLSDTDLDATTLGKPGHLAAPVQVKAPLLTGLPHMVPPAGQFYQPATSQRSSHLAYAEVDKSRVPKASKQSRSKEDFLNQQMSMPYDKANMAAAALKAAYVIDAKDIPVGRVATAVAKIAMGKHQPFYTPHLNFGDKVIVTNAEKVLFTGKKGDRNKGKVYQWYTGYPGGSKTITAGKILEGPHPERVLAYAIQGMLPKTKLGKKFWSNVHIQSGEA
jgi:large subunit ribosomal protein L13